MRMDLTKETVVRLAHMVGHGETGVVWVTGRPIPELPFWRLAQYCKTRKASRRDCMECPLMQLCSHLGSPMEGDLDWYMESLRKYGHSAAAEMTLPQMTQEAVKAMKENGRENCWRSCPMGEGDHCAFCPADWLDLKADYWRHTEDELE